MKNFVKYLCGFAVAATLSFSGSVFAGQQVDADDYRCSRGAKVFNGRTDGLCYDTTTKTPVLIENGDPSIIPGSATFTVVFDRGAGLGFQLMQQDGTVFDTTAGASNLLYYSGGFIGGWNNPVDVGAVTPAALAAGIEMMPTAANDNDHAEMFMGTLGASGRPFEVGTDVAFQLCATMKLATLADTDLLVVGFRDPAPVTVTPGSYTAYAGIGLGSATGDVYVWDITTGGTDTTDGLLAATSGKFCTLVSSTGVVTYKFDNSAPTVTDAHSFTDGTMLIPFISLRSASATPTGNVIVKVEVSYQ